MNLLMERFAPTVHAVARRKSVASSVAAAVKMHLIRRTATAVTPIAGRKLEKKCFSDSHQIGAN